MTFFPIPAFNDNYIWAIHGHNDSQIWVVDPGSAEAVMSYCTANQVSVVGILITHHHKDHTGGVNDLVSTYNCPVYGPESLTSSCVTHAIRQGDSVSVHNLDFLVLETPGHTLDHLCYFAQPDTETAYLFCGDTLFKGGCGRLFEGTPAQMLNAMTRLRELPNFTQVFATHEYTLANYRFARTIDPSNTTLIEAERQAQRLREDNQPTLPSSIGLESQTNPFMRFDNLDVVKGAAKVLNEPPAEDLITAFAQIRRAKDGF